jgi:uncharacterized caspase-like protein
MTGSRLALVVANDQYADPGLHSLAAPAQDAAALAEVLTDPSVGGFDVRVLHNESAQEIRFAVEDFFADRAPEDLLLLHFSCHGLKNSAGELYLAVADTQPTRLASTAVAADFVNRQMADSRAQRIALFLDCCYGGAFPRGMVVRAAGEAQVRDAFAGQEEVGGGRGRVVVTASSAMEYAFEGGRLATDGAAPTPSVFTSAVVDGLTTGEADRDGDGWIGLTELVGYVSDQVRRVTPNQNPQMWTFGSQGELLIARSRVRRITPAPLAPELRQAMESPLSAARFGVVDYLRERLYDEDLGQAYAAWQALHEMVDDDSRKVSDAATKAIAEAVPRVSPAEVLLGADMTAELQVGGPPIAQTAVASSDAEWLRVAQDATTVRITAETSEPGDHVASVIVAGPTGECTVPVRLTLPDTESEPPSPPPEPEPPPKPTPQPTPQPPEPEQTQPALVPVAVEAPTTAADVPVWAVAALTLGALLLVYLNWPGLPATTYVWYDHDNTGWVVYRTWHDPVILSSLGALAAALVARWARPIALGVVAGCAVSLIEGGLVILGSGIAWTESGKWAANIAIAVAMTVVLLVVLRPTIWRLWPLPALAAALIVVGGILLVVSAMTKHPDGFSWLTVTKLALLEPLVPVVLAGLAVAAPQTRSRTWLRAAVTTYAVVGVIGAVPAVTEGNSPSAFVTALLGNALVVAGVLIPVRRPRSRP